MRIKSLSSYLFLKNNWFLGEGWRKQQWMKCSDKALSWCPEHGWVEMLRHSAGVAVGPVGAAVEALVSVTWALQLLHPGLELRHVAFVQVQHEGSSVMPEQWAWTGGIPWSWVSLSHQIMETSGVNDSHTSAVYCVLHFTETCREIHIWMFAEKMTCWMGAVAKHHLLLFPLNQMFFVLFPQ